MKARAKEEDNKTWHPFSEPISHLLHYAKSTPESLVIFMSEFN